MKIRTIAALSALALVAVTLVGAPASAATSWLSGHVQNIGWVDGAPSTVVDGATWAGSNGQNLRLEALRLNVPAEAPFTMRGHSQNIGWMDQKTDSVGRRWVGTTGKSLRLEAVQLTPIAPSVWTVWCQAYVAGKGWLAPVKNGATCGTTGESRRMETVRVWLAPADGQPTTPPTTPPTTAPEPVLSTIVTVGDIGLEAAGRTNLANMGKANADLALILGDLAYSPPAQTFCDTVKGSIGGPVGWVQGNHENRDADNPGPDPAVNDSTEAYQACMPDLEALGEPGVQQVISWQGVRIITASPQETADGYAPGSPRYEWVKSEIRKGQAAGAWVILAMHEPCYTPGAHGCAGTDSKALTDLAITERVPLVLAGHDHVYGRKQVGSTTFVVAGMGGHNPRTITSPDGWAATNPGAAFGFVKLTIREHSITGEFAGVDRFEVTR